MDKLRKSNVVNKIIDLLCVTLAEHRERFATDDNMQIGIDAKQNVLSGI